MQYRKLKANKIFDGYQWCDEDQVVIVSENDGTIKDMLSVPDAGDDIECLEGILAPGFINCHCHLELSHLKNKIPPNTGLVDFLLAVVTQRDFPVELMMEQAKIAEQEMAANGTVAVADICNTNHIIDIKKNSSLYFHNLIEVINLYDENLENQLSHFNFILSQYLQIDSKKFRSALTPHAPYSVSKATFSALNKISANAIISIHNQEAKAENELFKNGHGDFLRLYKALGADRLPLQISHRTSFQTWLPYLTMGQTILIVHNTFISEEDIVFGKLHAERYGLELIYCLCPNANLYIENRLPPIELLIKHGCKIVLGTDSYSSNWQLNIASEIKTLCDHYPQLALEKILQWGTLNGAEALRQNSLGHLSRGKNPGLVLLETSRLNNNALTGKSRRII